MNELQISEYMFGDEKISIWFNGVMSYDELPSTLEKGIYIVNTDPSTKPGSHWVVLANMNYDYIYYFDSLAKPPVAGIQSFLNKQNVTYKYSIKRLQSSNSDVCGDYCILFSYFISRGYNMEYFLSLFSFDTNHNDRCIEL